MSPELDAAIAAFRNAIARDDSSEAAAARLGLENVVRAALAAAEARAREATEALRRYTGPATGNEPVAERDALIAQCEEAEARAEAAERERDEAAKARDGYRSSWLAEESRRIAAERERDEWRDQCQDVKAKGLAAPASAEAAESDAARLREALRALHSAVSGIVFGEDADKRTWLVSPRTKLDAAAKAMAAARDLLDTSAASSPSERNQGGDR